MTRPILRPGSCPSRSRRYTADERRQLVALIDQGVPPLEVAKRLSVPIYRLRSGQRCSTIYQLYERWSGRIQDVEEAR